MREDETLFVHRELAVDLLIALRGRRSQTAFSKRLGYRSNIVQRWESGHSLPTAATFLGCCTSLKIDVAACFERFYGRPPEWLGRHAADSPAAVAAFLGDLRGKVPIKELAGRIGKNRYTVARWLSGQARPRLHEFLALVEAGSGRLLDFIAGLIDPARVPSLAAAWVRLERSREAAYETPWSHAVLRALELPAARRGSGGKLKWLSERLGVEVGVARDALEALTRSGQVERRSGRYRVTPVGDVDTGSDPARARLLKAHWTRTALERLQAGSPGLFGYAVFAVSRRDLRKLREVQLEYVQQINAIVGASRGEECVGLFCTQLLDLASSVDNALASEASGS